MKHKRTDAKREPETPQGHAEERQEQQQGGGDAAGEHSEEDNAVEHSSEEAGGGRHDEQQEGKQQKKKVLSEAKIKRMKELYAKRGVVYISRIPPHMKPMKLKQLLSAYGETLRVYCAPEDPKARKLRKRKGGNTGKNFTEGWVEFADKRVAKRTALALNSQRIGGRRRSAYYDDLWCIKYLPRFKWDDLTDEIAYQRAIHDQKMAAEVAAAKQERDFYLQQVDRAKGMRAIAERRAAKQAAGAGVEGGDKKSENSAPAEKGSTAAPRAPIVRNFAQRPSKRDPAADASAPQLADEVLMMVGSKKKQRVV